MAPSPYDVFLGPLLIIWHGLGILTLGRRKIFFIWIPRDHDKFQMALVFFFFFLPFSDHDLGAGTPTSSIEATCRWQGVKKLQFESI